MAFWDSWFGEPSGNTDSPGDPDGVEVNIERGEYRALPMIRPSPWAGWPAEWGVPNWDLGSRFNELIDVAWMCLDLNASVLSSMPVYKTRGGEIVSPETWMTNPDPAVYSSWHEFAKQLFWDFQLGEAFVLPMAFFSDAYPMTFRVIPPWLMHVEMRSGTRVYKLGGVGGVDVTADILHIRYKSSTDKAHGVGPLESAGGRMLTAGILAKYIREIAETGGMDDRSLVTDQELTPDDARDTLNMWLESRLDSSGAPPVYSRGIRMETHQRMSPRDMAMLELGQFTETRITNLLGVPGFLVDLPGGDDMTYSNVSQVFDFHDRRYLRTASAHVMAALSNWALPRGQAAELNRDEYSRPAFNERADAWVKLKDAGLVSVEQFQAAERLMSMVSAQALTGATLNGSTPDGSEAEDD